MLCYVVSATRPLAEAVAVCVKSVRRVSSTNKDEQRKGEMVKQRDVLGGGGAGKVKVQFYQ